MSPAPRVVFMPPRSIVAAVLLFWLGANGWMFYREVWPHWRSGEPPPYTIDLTEALGHASIRWDILKKDMRIRYAPSRGGRPPDRTSKMPNQRQFNKCAFIVLAA